MFSLRYIGLLVLCKSVDAVCVDDISGDCAYWLNNGYSCTLPWSATNCAHTCCSGPNCPPACPVTNATTAAATTTTTAVARPRVVGGTQAGDGEFSFQAKMGGCSGSLIGDTWVITAAHCVTDTAKNNAVKIPAMVNLGVYDQYTQSSNVQQILPKRVIRHASYTAADKGYDIALIELTKPAATRFARIRLYDGLPSGLDTPGSMVTISGWGATQTVASSQAAFKQKLDIPVVGQSQCQKGYVGTTIYASQICAGGVAGQGSCFGDSGGPLFYQDENDNFTLLGITSFGGGGRSDCLKTGAADIWTRVSSFVDWVCTQTGKQVCPGTSTTPALTAITTAITPVATAAAPAKAPPTPPPTFPPAINTALDCDMYGHNYCKNLMMTCVRRESGNMNCININNNPPPPPPTPYPPTPKPTSKPPPTAAKTRVPTMKPTKKKTAEPTKKNVAKPTPLTCSAPMVKACRMYGASCIQYSGFEACVSGSGR